MGLYGGVLPKLNWEEGRDIVLFLDRACVPISLVLAKMIFLQLQARGLHLVSPSCWLRTNQPTEIT